MVDRREFLKLGTATALTMPLLGTGEAQAKAPEKLKSGGEAYFHLSGTKLKAVPSTCWQCTSRCPIIGYLEDDRLVKIEGNPKSIRTNGKVCAKAQAGIDQVYDPDRILHPLRRVGKRGEGKWKQISWDEALTELAGRLKKLRDDGHPEKFMFHYGRMKGSSSKLIKSVFLATYGTGTIANHTSICEAAKWTAQELTWGKHYDNWDFDNTRFILNFGSNCLEAHTNHVPLAARLAPAMVDRGVKMVTFDVRLSNTAAKSTEWVPVKPGTDGAVVLAMCQVIIDEGLYTGAGEAFLEYCKVTANGEASAQEKVSALQAHLKSYTPEWAEKISGVGAEKIRAIARQFATTKPACVISYRGAVANFHGVETERAIQMLAAITGNIDNPGGRCRAVAAKWKYPKGPKKKPKAKKLNILNGADGQALLPTHQVSNQVFNMIRDGSAGRPDVYMWYCYQPVYSNADCQANIDVLKDETLLPFTVCVSPFYDESAALADLILPDATYLERWDWEDNVSPNQVPEYYIRQPLVKPLGESRNFADVCCDLAKRMGFPLGFKNMEDFVKKSCRLTPEVKRKARGFRGMKKKGVWHDTKAAPQYYAYEKPVVAAALQKEGVILDQATGVYWNWQLSGAKSQDDALARGYRDTPKAYKGYVGQTFWGQVRAGFKPDALNKSGFFEIYSEIMAAKGLSALPGYTAAPEHEAMKPDELILTTYKVNVQSHSRTQNCKWLTEIYHDNPAWINPITANDRGIRDGERIKVKSAIGEIETEVLVTQGVAPGVIAISMHCGHWQYGRYASAKKAPFGDATTRKPEHVWWSNNGVHPNWIIPNSADPITGQQRWMDTVVSISKA